jgi:hypothetical protein
MCETRLQTRKAPTTEDGKEATEGDFTKVEKKRRPANAQSKPKKKPVAESK